MKTKKFIVPFDMKNPSKTITGFLYPNFNLKDKDTFVEIYSNKDWEHGVVVFLGTEITIDDAFARIIDSGIKINSVSEVKAMLESYFNKLNNLKIGDLVKIKINQFDFDLIKIKKPDNPKRKFGFLAGQ